MKQTIIKIIRIKIISMNSIHIIGPESVKEAQVDFDVANV